MSISDSDLREWVKQAIGQPSWLDDILVVVPDSDEFVSKVPLAEVRLVHSCPHSPEIGNARSASAKRIATQTPPGVTIEVTTQQAIDGAPIMFTLDLDAVRESLLRCPACGHSYGQRKLAGADAWQTMCLTDGCDRHGVGPFDNKVIPL